MKERQTIQKLRAAALLVLFTISFIPKSYFHDVIASHTDSVGEGCQHPDKKQACLRQQGFKCGFTDLVVTASYLSPENSITCTKPAEFPSFTEPFYPFNLQQYFFGTDSRGPPAEVV